METTVEKSKTQETQTNEQVSKQTTTTARVVTLPTPLLQELVARAVKGSTMQEYVPLSHLMKVSVKNKELQIKTTDLVNYMILTAKVDVDDFELVTESKLFSQTIAKISTTTTTIELSRDGITITGNGRYNLVKSTDVDGSDINFPEIQYSVVGNAHHVTVEEIKSILSLNNSCKDEKKEVPCLHGYYMNADRVLTTNTFKACTNPIKMFDNEVLLKPEIVNLIPYIMDDSGVDVYQAVIAGKAGNSDKELVCFSSSKGTLFGVKAPSVDLQKFPATDLITLFDEKITHKVKINRTMLLKAIDRMSLFIDEYQKNKIVVIFESKQVTLYDGATESEESIPYLEELTETFNPVQLNVDINYLKSEISASTHEKLIIGFHNEIGMFIECGNATMALGVMDPEIV